MSFFDAEFDALIRRLDGGTPSTGFSTACMKAEQMTQNTCENNNPEEYSEMIELGEIVKKKGRPFQNGVCRKTEGKIRGRPWPRVGPPIENLKIMPSIHSASKSGMAMSAPISKTDYSLLMSHKNEDI